MNIITPFQFIKRFPEDKSMIFVGNAPSLIGESLGKWIDSHDIVVRFNDCPTQGFELDIGTKTDILVTNPYVEGRDNLRSVSGNTLIFVIMPQTRRGDENLFKQWVGNRDVLFTYTPDLVGLDGVDHKAALTTGTYAIHLFSRILRHKKVSITGFTMFLKDTWFHYFGSIIPKGLLAHRPEVEGGIFIKICNNIRSIVEITEDVAWVSRRARIKLRKDISVKPLIANKWKN